MMLQRVSTRRRIPPWPMLLLLAAGAFVIFYPLYYYIDGIVTGGIHTRGNLLQVDLKAMSNFDMDQSAGTTSDIPAIYRQLDGRRVLLTGQMWDPYTASGSICNFSLVYSINNCCFIGPPKVQHFVQATVPQGHRVDYYPNDFVQVVGTLHVGVQSAKGQVQSVYRIDVEKVVPE